MAIYLMCVYGSHPLAVWFREAWAKTGKKLDMGKACIRFKRVEDLALDVIGEVIRRAPAQLYIKHCLAAIGNRPKARKKAPPKKKPAKARSGK